MADYKAMYLAAMDAMERAIETLTAAQQRCEDLYVATSGEEATLRLTQTGYPSCAAALSA